MARMHRKTLPRCGGCQMHLELCICALIEPIEIRTRVVVIMHAKEEGKSSNSGRLVPLALRSGEVRVRGRKAAPMSQQGLVDPGHLNLVLYPADDAKVLAPEWLEADGRPVSLFVPDGNWRQAKRVARREPSLVDLQRVILPPGPPSRYRLRSHPDPKRVSTFEAIARALGIIEGPKVQAHLEGVFDLLVERTLWTRGELSAEQVLSGIPDAARYV